MLDHRIDGAPSQAVPSRTGPLTDDEARAILDGMTDAELADALSNAFDRLAGALLEVTTETIRACVELDLPIDEVKADVVAEAPNILKMLAIKPEDPRVGTLAAALGSAFDRLSTALEDSDQLVAESAVALRELRTALAGCSPSGEVLADG
jgi:hypothetical protein